MGVVYRAEDTRLGRQVALKFLPPERVADPDRKRRFIREARAASALNHPSIITIHEIAEEGGADFIVMEHVSGRTLSQVVAGKPLPVKETLGYAAQIADALIAAHRAGIIHRDLKPGNVMVTDDGRAKVLDFGLAKLRELAPPGTESTLTLVVGTAAYMAPEQAEGQAVDARSDIYSFGAVLYEMLAGRRAFASMGREEPAPLSGVSPDLQRIVARCLRRSPAERFQTAAELKAALERTGQEACSTPSIAVLPFANLSADKENEYFSDGLTEELINALAQLEGLRVVSRTSVFRFKGAAEDVRDIGRKLQVAAVLEGTVRRAGSRLRVTAQLIDVADGYHLWSRRFDREMKDAFEVQDELAQAIVETLKIKLGTEDRARLARRYTANPRAHELCLQGRYHFYQFTKTGFHEAIEYFARARTEDPDCAEAAAWLAAAYFCLVQFGWERPRDVMPKATAAVHEALRIDPDSANAHTVLAGIRHWYEWDWAGAEKEYRRALELNPGDAFAHVTYAEALAHLGRFEQALAMARRAVDLEPVSLETNRMLGLVLLLAQRYQEAIVQCQATLELDPHYYYSHLCLALVYGTQGRYPEARKAAAQAVELAPGEPVCEATLGWVLAAAGERAAATRILDELTARRLRGYCSALLIGWIHSGLGQAEEALRWIETAVEDRDPLVAALRVFPLAGSLCATPSLQRLLGKTGLGN